MSEPVQDRRGMDRRSGEDRRAGLAGLLTTLRPGTASQTATATPAMDEAERRAISEAAFARGLAEGRAEGLAEGLAEAEAALQPRLAAMEAALLAFEQAMAIDPERLRPLLAGLVRSVAERVLAAELSGAGPVLLMPLVAEALETLGPVEAPVLRAHPDTLAALGAALEGRMESLADPKMPVCSFVIEGPAFQIGADLGRRLDQIMAQLP